MAENQQQPSKSQIELILDALIDSLEKYPQEFPPETVDALRRLAQSGKMKHFQQVQKAVSLSEE